MPEVALVVSVRRSEPSALTIEIADRCEPPSASMKRVTKAILRPSGDQAGDAKVASLSEGIGTVRTPGPPEAGLTHSSLSEESGLDGGCLSHAIRLPSADTAKSPSS